MRTAPLPIVLVLCAAGAGIACADHGGATAPAAWPQATGAQTTTERTAAGANGGANASSPACGKSGPPSGVLAQHVPVFGKSRNYTLVVPANYNATVSYPLVYVLHGHGGTGAQARTALDLESAGQDHAIFLYPDGLGGGWDLDSPASKNPDVALFDATLALTQGSYCIDLRRVFIAGFSNGGYMANQLACRRGDRIRAVASHSGGGPYETTGEYDAQGRLVCKGKAVASLVVHGTSDGTVAPAEGQKSVDHWSFANHCLSGTPTPPALSSKECAAYQHCESPVIACKVPGLGHSVWPHAKQLTWGFFDAQK